MCIVCLFVYDYFTVVLVHKPAPGHEGEERLQKEADHSRVVDGGFNKRGNLFTRLVLGSCRQEISIPAHQNLENYFRGLN